MSGSRSVSCRNVDILECTYFVIFLNLCRLDHPSLIVRGINKHCANDDQAPNQASVPMKFQTNLEMTRNYSDMNWLLSDTSRLIKFYKNNHRRQKHLCRCC